MHGDETEDAVGESGQRGSAGAERGYPGQTTQRKPPSLLKPNAASLTRGFTERQTPLRRVLRGLSYWQLTWEGHWSQSDITGPPARLIKRTAQLRARASSSVVSVAGSRVSTTRGHWRLSTSMG